MLVSFSLLASASLIYALVVVSWCWVGGVSVDDMGTTPIVNRNSSSLLLSWV